MFLISSAAYIDSEFVAEVGLLPPAFLPVSCKRLFELQLKEIKRLTSEKVFLSLPSSFEIELKDISLLNKLRVEIVYNRDGLSIGESIFQSLKVCDVDEPVRILYGDTLIFNFPKAYDLVSISNTNDNYKRHVDSYGIVCKNTWAGFFSFSTKSRLLYHLEKKNYDFFDAVNAMLEQKEVGRNYVSKCMDFGHINTYFELRRKLTTERSFNKLQVEKNVVTKKSANTQKLMAESNWFKRVPSSIRRLTPSLIKEVSNCDSPSYSIEYMHSIPLNELLVFGKMPESSWKSIIDSCKVYFDEAVKTEITPSEDLLRERYQLFHDKTYRRIEVFKKQAPFNFSQTLIFNGKFLPSIENILKSVLVDALNIEPVFSVLHGDFCFSNIIYDNRSKVIKLVDPRGISEEGNITIYGDLLYDLAKFYHSALGSYDFIVSGYYQLDIDGQNINFSTYASEHIQFFRDVLNSQKLLKDYSESDILPIVIILFLSMLPLHDEEYERQCALLANALRLYVIYTETKQ